MNAIAAGLFAIAVVGAAALVQFRYDMAATMSGSVIVRDWRTGSAATCWGGVCRSTEITAEGVE